MGECRRISDELERAFRGQAWHGPSLRENLEGVPAETAAKKPIAGAHSIWEIALHVAAWDAESAAALNGKEYVTLEGESDWPPPRGTWEAALESLDRAHAALMAAVANFPEERLRERVSGKEFSFYGLLHGLSQHHAYHSGQIAMLKKAAAIRR
jgi:uncharacterized damage-inducible protein DinB